MTRLPYRLVFTLPGGESCTTSATVHVCAMKAARSCSCPTISSCPTIGSPHAWPCHTRGIATHCLESWSAPDDWRRLRLVDVSRLPDQHIEVDNLQGQLPFE